MSWDFRPLGCEMNLQEFARGCSETTAQYRNSRICGNERKVASCEGRLSLWGWQSPRQQPRGHGGTARTVLAHSLLASSLHGRLSPLPPNQGSMKAHSCLSRLRPSSPQMSGHHVRGCGKGRSKGEGGMIPCRNTEGSLKFSPC